MVRGPNRGGDTRLLQLSNRGEEKPSTDNSIITQVSRDDPPGPASSPPSSRASRGGEVAVKGQNAWLGRLRALCCCGPSAAGSDEQFYRNSETEVAVIRPPQPPIPPEQRSIAVIGPLQEQDRGKKTLVLDLDETLVHSSFKPIPNPDFIIPVDIEDKVVDVYVLKRPLMDKFMAAIAGRFEIIVFTASLAKYADPLLDLLDPQGVVRWRLFREACCPFKGNYVKDLLCLGRPLSDVIIVDNSPHSYVFQPDNALPIGTFIDEPDDVELEDMLPVLADLEKVGDVRQHLGRLIAQQQQRQAQQQSLKAREPYS